ncbi:nucleoside triphosphate pyrophosphatase [Corynebacterium bovis]|uniref:nucleoside triphosphate pyrophosphatase n=1 Tax=Corynebacterium bovis TaxID=36808 RepID=UPI000F63C007|nr:nucleoside triphosphate pyrophosphatase [Corynebacterium bovis]MDN8580138.1 nucleoside triphosphate pyrophosphatase [Corynebacterium bovis]RRO87561.1 septum formation inhibitor Maf [Corynebacterium bovis]
MSGRPDATGRTPRRRLVLASSSPSRLSVLRSAGVEPLVVVPGTDEDAAVAALRATAPDPTPADIVTHLARAKATAVARMLREGTAGVQAPADAVILAGDSMLLIDGELQGKPHTEEATVDRWRHQRGRTAELVTGHCVIVPGTGAPDATRTPDAAISPAPGTGTPDGPDAPGAVETGTSTTRVHFADVTDDEIRAYARTGEPWGCAGAFTLEALGGWFIDRIEGDPSGVIGLSLPLVRRLLARRHLSVTDLWHL